jgi:hypothetical protein
MPENDENAGDEDAEAVTGADAAHTLETRPCKSAQAICERSHVLPKTKSRYGILDE